MGAEQSLLTAATQTAMAWREISTIEYTAGDGGGKPMRSGYRPSGFRQCENSEDKTKHVFA
eukprot:scaffold53608_cov30-Tisochrysis_lutea.AAC.6